MLGLTEVYRKCCAKRTEEFETCSISWLYIGVEWVFADGRVYVVRLETLGDPRYGPRLAPTRFALRRCEQTWSISIRRYRAVP